VKKLKFNSKINQLKVGATLSYISMGLGYIISIIYTPIMIKKLGQSEYGLYNLVASVVAYLGVLNFGFGSAYIRYYLRYRVKDEQEKIAILNGMFLVIFSGIGLIAVIAGTILSINTNIIFGSELTAIELSRAKNLIIILIVNLAISFPCIIFNSHITANERFVFQKLVQMIRNVINPFIVLPVLLLGYGSVGMVLITTTLNVFIEIINAVYCIKVLKMRFSFKYFDFRLMREMTIFSSYIFINMIVDQINWNADKFILGRFHGTVAVAVYGLAAQINTYYLSISLAISGVFIPRVHRIVAQSNDNNALTELFTMIGRIQFIILSLISTGLIFFGRPFINMWAGNSYDGAYGILLLLIIPGTVSSTIQNIGIEIQRAKNLHQFRSWTYIIIAIVNIAITIPLAKLYGGIGAATGTAIAIIIGNGLAMNWYYHAKVGIDIVYFWKQILGFVPALIPSILAGIVFNLLFELNGIINFLCFGLIYVMVFGISMWFLGMNQYEKNLMSDPLKRIYRKVIKRS
jgi:O-antigen/teichoic acid export membrane protein